MDTFSLLAANFLILSVFAISFLAAFHDMKQVRYWRTWTFANIFLGAAMIVYIFESELPRLLVILVPNGLQLVAFLLFSQAARQFNGLRVSRARNWIVPIVLVSTGLVSHASGNFSLSYIATNLILTVLSFDTAREYLRLRSDGLSSRYGLSLSFALAGVSSALHVVQGLLAGRSLGLGLPDDLLMSVHLAISLIFVTACGAFSLALAFERKTAEQREAAHRDPLTGAFNRREFTQRLKALLSGPVVTPFALVQFDLDHFKSVNDRYGHGAGDEALQLCSDIMQWHLRDEDCLARIGGEEFAALMPQISHEEALGIAERIRRTVAEMPLHFAGDGVRITLSAGVYHGTGDGLDHKQLLKLADDGLYQSKNSGRNRISLVGAMAANDGERLRAGGPKAQIGTDVDIDPINISKTIIAATR